VPSVCEAERNRNRHKPCGIRIYAKLLSSAKASLHIAFQRFSCRTPTRKPPSFAGTFAKKVRAIILRQSKRPRPISCCCGKTTYDGACGPQRDVDRGRAVRRLANGRPGIRECPETESWLSHGSVFGPSSMIPRTTRISTAPWPEVHPSSCRETGISGTPPSWRLVCACCRPASTSANTIGSFELQET
jgi:hypothetical protein